MSLPLHPALVHLPLGIAMVLPLLIAACFATRWLDRTGRAAWVPVALAATLLTASSFVALQTGEADEDRVEAVVGEGPLEAHEEAGKVFAWSTAALLILCLVPLAVPGRGYALTAQSLALAASVVVLVLGHRAGRAGGELVYLHGGASARGSSKVGGVQALPPACCPEPNRPGKLLDGGHGEGG